ncbi:hypothetical protein [Rhodopirellula islandica]|nr:hypothetical protein [Rhodopirellula islandica]
MNASLPATEPRQVDDGRLGIFQLMVITAGIAIAFAIGRGLGTLRRVPDWPWRSETAETIQTMDLLVASVYGLSLAVFFLAVRSQHFWTSLGKTLALLFANMCVLD